jgi:cytochrome oxidase Cu insertion factor (SCO1/SenC/PrrC family)
VKSQRRSAVVLLAALGLAGCNGRPSAPPPEPLEFAPFPLSDFRLTERSGSQVSKADLLGKVWIASFVFTRCTGPCPQVSAAMTRLQHDLADEPDVRLVTFTVDPGRDDRAELRRYAEHFHADPERWLFLTGGEADVYRLLHEGFHVAAEQNQGEDRKPGAEVLHDTHLVLVDRLGRIRGYYQGLPDSRDDDPSAAFEDNLKRLRARVAVLLREKP